MKIIIITGPSGSGKTYLSSRLSKLLRESIVINTDSYYRDCFLMKPLSVIIDDLYDRLISIRRKEILKTILSIYKREKYTNIYNYDFKSKVSSKSKINIQSTNDIKFLILEGIFSHRLDLNYSEAINIICQAKKEICLQRRLDRDTNERDRKAKEVYLRFAKSWDLYFSNIHQYLNNYKILHFNTADNNSYKKLNLILEKYQ